MTPQDHRSKPLCLIAAQFGSRDMNKSVWEGAGNRSFLVLSLMGVVFQNWTCVGLFLGCGLNLDKYMVLNNAIFYFHLSKAKFNLIVFSPFCIQINKI